MHSFTHSLFWIFAKYAVDYHYHKLHRTRNVRLYVLSYGVVG